MLSISRYLIYLTAVLIVLVFFSSDGYSQQHQQTFDFNDYDLVLKTYVDENGMVNYSKLNSKSQQLDAFVAAMSKLEPKSFEAWGEKDKIAFWLNAYNALTLKVIIDNYPIKHSFLKAMYYPKNSIRQIPGVWDKITFDVMGKDLTLSEIEHEILRKKFAEPRIHMAMVCAAMGCPVLRNEAYLGEKLDSQLDDQTRKFLGDPEKFQMDRNNKKIYLSPILNWFAKDFVEKYSPEEKIPDQSSESSAVLNFLATYLDENDSTYLRSDKFKIKYLKYDWSLNEQ